VWLATAPGCLALPVNLIVNRPSQARTFQGYGVEALTDTSDYGGSPYYGAEGILAGAAPLGDYHIAGGRQDWANHPVTDGDASDVAAAIEAGHVLSGYQFPGSLVFLAFDREERGAAGGSVWPAAHASDRNLGTLAPDTTGYNPAGGFCGGAGIGWGAPAEVKWSGDSLCRSAFDSAEMSGYLDLWHPTAAIRGAGFPARNAEPVPEPSATLQIACGLTAIAAVGRRLRAQSGQSCSTARTHSSAINWWPA